MIEYPPVDGSEPCREVPEAFFPDPGDNRTAQFAKNLCRGCHVRDQCLTFALADVTRLLGVWGGTTATERAQLRRQRGAA